jgi:hypothetical protein
MTLGILSTGFGSCSRTVTQACKERFPQFEQELNAIRTEVDDLSQTRLIAAVDSDVSSKNKQHWTNWAAEELDETQRYIDLLDQDPRFYPARNELSALANDLVTFHGYAVQKKYKQMIKVLDRMEGHSEKARDLACSRPQK